MLRVLAVAACTFTTLALTGCATPSTPGVTEGVESRTATTTASPTPAAPSPAPTTSGATVRPSRTPVSPSSEGRPRTASLTIPTIGLHDLRVVPYRGSPDDAPGTRIQSGGVAASPHGPRGGVGPGGVGNYLVTAHRTSSTRAFADLPALRAGDRVHVETARTRYTYRITRTRTTSFRSQRSLAQQSAAVPGHRGRRPTRAMITLSTCATPEDHANGNYWADQFGNPEHRIDKIGVLVDARDTRR